MYSLIFKDGLHKWLKEDEKQATYFSFFADNTVENSYSSPLFCALALTDHYIFDWSPFAGTLAEFKQTAKEQSKANEEKKPKWTVEKRSYAFWIKFYAEQVGFVSEGRTMADADDDRKTQEHYLHEFLNRLLLFVLGKCNDSVKIHGILHYADTLNDDFFNPSVEKPHVHLLLVFKKRVRFRALLSLLQQVGFVVRDEDKTLLECSVHFPDLRKKEHIRFLVYHTHETDDAQSEGKYQYERSECTTNYTKSELEKIYDEYFTQLSKNTTNKFDIILKCRELGSHGRDWLPYFEGLPLSLRVNSKLKQQCEQEYNSGINEFLSTASATALNRCCIFIWGAPSAGKTYNSKVAIQNLNLKSHVIDGGGTGKLDELRPYHQAMIVSDSSLGDDVLAVADNTVSRLYRRNSDNCIWMGKYLVVTYNHPLDEYIKRFYPLADKQAIHNRFFVCFAQFDDKLKRFQLRVDEKHAERYGLRGTQEDIEEKIYMLRAFVSQYNASSLNYIPKASNAFVVSSAFGKYFSTGEFI